MAPEGPLRAHTLGSDPGVLREMPGFLWSLEGLPRGEMPDEVQLNVNLR